MKAKCKPTISIIIPVYNVEEYLPKCIESVLQQSLRNIEVICVNDGSTDGSLKCLRQYAVRDSRITLLDQPNGGVSSARNLALSIATGDYVRFVDGDDHIPSNACESWVKCAQEKNADIVLSGVQWVSESTGLGWERKFGDRVYDFHKNEDLRAAYKNISQLGVSSVFFRQNVIEGLQFETLANGEDCVFYAQALCRASRIATMSQPLYFYFKRDSSASHAMPANVLRNLFDALTRTYWIYCGSCHANLIRDALSQQAIRTALFQLGLLIKSERKLTRQETITLWQRWLMCYIPVMKDARNCSLQCRLFYLAMLYCPSYPLFKYASLIPFSVRHLCKSIRGV